MKESGGFWKPAVITVALAALVMAAALALVACGGGTTATASPQASSDAGRVQSTQRHGHLGDTLVLSDGADGQLEVTALRVTPFIKIAFTHGTGWNVYGVKLKLRNVGTTPIHLAAVGANSVLFDVGGWRYDYPGDNPKSALYEVNLGLPGDSRVGWVYFTTPATGASPNGFHYTARSSDVASEGDTGEWDWKLR